MDETKTYIIEIPQVVGDETMIFLETDGDAVKSLFAIIELSDRGASVVDNCYRSIGEAQSAWQEAIAPKPYHLTPSAIEQNCTRWRDPEPETQVIGRARAASHR